MKNMTMVIILSIMTIFMMFFNQPVTAEGSVSIANGEVIFFKNCEKCHEKGSYDFSNAEDMMGKSPATTFKMIKRGEGKMPPFEYRFSDAEVWDVVFFIWTLQSSDEQRSQGKETYIQHCKGCHGEKFTPGSLDSTDQDFFKSLSEHLILGESLSDEEKWNVISYVRSLLESETGEVDTETLSSTESKTANVVPPEQASSPTPTKAPGFEALFAMFGILAVTLLIRSRKMR